MARAPAVRRITAPVREGINRLAGILYDFLPLSSRSPNTTTFRSIFAESGVETYLDGPSNKRQALEQGLSELLRRHPKLPFTVVRKVVPAAVEYRKYRRNPLKRAEVASLSECLGELGIDMRAELADVELDQRLPRVTVPPGELTRRLRGYDLDATLASEPVELFANGHFNEAVRKATERFEDQVREVSGITAHGRDLMARAFGASGTIDTTGLQPENEEDFRDGYKFLAMGVMAAVRNVFSHGDEERRSPEECFEMLLFLNWMFRALRPSDQEG